MCEDTCAGYAHDGICDDGGDGDVTEPDECGFGTDCADCGTRLSDGQNACHESYDLDTHVCSQVSALPCAMRPALRPVLCRATASPLFSAAGYIDRSYQLLCSQTYNLHKLTGSSSVCGYTLQYIAIGYPCFQLIFVYNKDCSCSCPEFYGSDDAPELPAEHEGGTAENCPCNVNCETEIVSFVDGVMTCDCRGC
jgi:hypothetical protein